MSAVKISIQTNGRQGLGQPRTEVFINGQFAYETISHPNIAKKQFEKVIELARLENIQVVLE